MRDILDFFEEFIWPVIFLVFWIVLFSFIFWLAGYGERQFRDSCAEVSGIIRVDPNQDVLECWKNGKKIAKLGENDPRDNSDGFYPVD